MVKSSPGVNPKPRFGPILDSTEAGEVGGEAHLSIRDGQRHVGASVRNANHHHLAHVSRLLRVESRDGGHVERVRERRAAAARHALEPVLGHRDGARRRKDDLGRGPSSG